jgi:hypothetical protein
MSDDRQARIDAILAGLPESDGKPVDKDKWPDKPIALPGTQRVPPWPRGLGDFVDAYINAVATFTATPPDLAGNTVLSAIATNTQRWVKIEAHIGWREPTNLYLAPLAASGEGKTPAYLHPVMPLYDVATKRADSLAVNIASQRAERKAREARLRHLEVVAAKTEPGQLGAALKNVRECAAQVEEVNVPAKPVLFTKEATPEGLVRLLAEQDGYIAVLTDEGVDFFEMASRYSGNGQANHGIYLAGYDGLPWRSDRAGRDPIDLARVTITVMVMIQPGTLKHLAKDRMADARGLYARFLWSKPESMVGHRPTHRAPVPEWLSDRWLDLLTSLAGIGKLPITLTLDARAKHLFDDWRTEHETKLRPEGNLASIPEAANKMPGQVLRLAAGCHAARTKLSTTVVTEPTMVAAIGLGDYYIKHDLAVYSDMRSGGATEDARAVLRWLQMKQERRITTRDLATSKDWEAERTRDALAMLEQYGWVRRAEPEQRPGRPSERWDVHPKSVGVPAQNGSEP